MHRNIISRILRIIKKYKSFNKKLFLKWLILGYWESSIDIICQASKGETTMQLGESGINIEQ